MTRIFDIRALPKALGVRVGPNFLADDTRTTRQTCRGLVTSLVVVFSLVAFAASATACVGPVTPTPIAGVDPISDLVNAARTTMSWIVVGAIFAFVLNGLAQFWIHRE